MAKRTKKKGKFTLYKLFNPEGSGKGLTKEQAAAPRNFKNFFGFAWRNFGNLVSLNILMILGNFPIILAIIGGLGYFNINSTTPASTLFASLFGSIQISGTSPAKSALLGVYGVQLHDMILTTPSLILIYAGLLVLITFGPVNVGTAYVMRNIVRGEPIFLYKDFWYAIKKNLKQGLIMGAIDALMLFVLGYDIFLFYGRFHTTFGTVSAALMIAVLFVYLVMRFYIYPIMVTFDLSIFKILKNSLIFSILGIKRNLLAMLGIAAVLVINFAIYVLLMPLGIMLPFIITFALMSFIGIYASYPKIKEIMIDPYYKNDRPGAEKRDPESESDGSDDSDDDTICTDMG